MALLIKQLSKINIGKDTKDRLNPPAKIDDRVIVNKTSEEHYFENQVLNGYHSRGYNIKDKFMDFQIFKLTLLNKKEFYLRHAIVPRRGLRADGSIRNHKGEVIAGSLDGYYTADNLMGILLAMDFTALRDSTMGVVDEKEYQTKKELMFKDPPAGLKYLEFDKDPLEEKLNFKYNGKFVMDSDDLLFKFLYFVSDELDGQFSFQTYYLNQNDEINEIESKNLELVANDLGEIEYKETQNPQNALKTLSDTYFFKIVYENSDWSFELKTTVEKVPNGYKLVGKMNALAKNKEAVIKDFERIMRKIGKFGDGGIPINSNYETVFPFYPYINFDCLEKVSSTSENIEVRKALYLLEFLSFWFNANADDNHIGTMFRNYLTTDDYVASRERDYERKVFYENYTLDIVKRKHKEGMLIQDKKVKKEKDNYQNFKKNKNLFYEKTGKTPDISFSKKIGNTSLASVKKGEKEEVYILPINKNNDRAFEFILNYHHNIGNGGIAYNGGLKIFVEKAYKAYMGEKDARASVIKKLYEHKKLPKNVMDFIDENYKDPRVINSMLKRYEVYEQRLFNKFKPDGDRSIDLDADFEVSKDELETKRTIDEVISILFENYEIVYKENTFEPVKVVAKEIEPSSFYPLDETKINQNAIFKFPVDIVKPNDKNHIKFNQSYYLQGGIIGMFLDTKTVVIFKENMSYDCFIVDKGATEIDFFGINDIDMRQYEVGNITHKVGNEIYLSNKDNKIRVTIKWGKLQNSGEIVGVTDVAKRLMMNRRTNW